MQKCRADELLMSVISLAEQCTEGVQFNWYEFLCKEFLENFREA